MPPNFVNTLYDDIEAAGIPRKDAAGRVLDLHALRHTFGTRLIAAGVDIKTVQALMRHSTPVLTLGIYVHSDRARLRQAVEQLPELAPLPEQRVDSAMPTAAAGA
jgi:site-specific recombinase XerD